MKVNVIPGLLVLMVSALLAYWFYSMSDDGEQMSKALALSGFLSLGVSSFCGVGISFEEKHRSINKVAVSTLFFIIFMIEHICFSLWGTNPISLFILSGILVIVYLLLFNGISQMGDVESKKHNE